MTKRLALPYSKVDISQNHKPAHETIHATYVLRTVNSSQTAQPQPKDEMRLSFPAGTMGFVWRSPKDAATLLEKTRASRSCRSLPVRYKTLLFPG